MAFSIPVPNSNTRGTVKASKLWGSAAPGERMPWGYEASGARTAVDMVRRDFGFHRDQVEGAVAHATFGRELFGEGPHVFCTATQDDGFQAVVMIKVDMH